MKTYYVTDGDVRGRCGHKHRTIEGAQRCVKRDLASCKAQGGYSDRYVCAVENGHARALNERESRYVDALDEGRVL